MAHFANGYEGDTISLNYILQTQSHEDVFIAGVTENPNISVSVSGETAYINIPAAANVKKGTVGGKVDFASIGVTTKSISMLTSQTIGDIIPHANYMTVAADVVNARWIQQSEKAQDAINTDALTQLFAASTKLSVTTALTKDNVYDLMVDSVTEFNTTTEHLALKLKATGFIVSAQTYALLLKAPQFLRSTAISDAAVSNGYVGSLAGLPVVVSSDLATIGADFLVVNCLGIGVPTNVNSMKQFDATPVGYPDGTGIAGEIGYGVLAVEKYSYYYKGAAA